jgi:hypothetical protein
MAITYVGGRGAGRANGTSALSVAINSGLSGGSGGAPIEGDLVVVTVSTGTAARAPTLSISTPTGYTALTAQRTTATTYDTNVQTSYKFMGSTPDTTVTIPASGNAADGQAYTIQVFRGVDPTTPLDVTPTYATGSGANNRPDPAAITPITSGAWIVVCTGGAAATGTTALTASYLTNLLFFNGADTNDGNVASGYYTGWTSGSYDPAVFAGGSVNAANSWGATTIALRPIAAATFDRAAVITSDSALTVTPNKITNRSVTITSDSSLTTAYTLPPPPSGGEITYLGSVNNEGTTAALDLTPLNLQEGDFLLAAATDDNGTGGVLGSPWTSLYGARPVSTGGYNDYLICGPTPPTSVDFPGNVSGVVVAFRGVDTTTPFDVTAPTETLAISGMPDPPSITTVTDGAVIVIIGHLDDDSTIGATIAAPTNYTLAGWGQATDLSGSSSITMVAYRTLATAGTDDPGAFTSTGGTDDWLAHTYALRPAPGGGGNDRTATIASVSTFSALAKKITNRATAVSSDSTLAVLSKTIRNRAAAVSSASTLTVNREISKNRAAAVSSTSSVTINRTITRSRPVAVTSTSSLIALAKIIRNRATVVASTSSTTALSKTIRNRQVLSSSASSLAAVSKVIRNRPVVINGVSTLDVNYVQTGTFPRDAAIASTSSVVVNRTVTRKGTVAVASTSSLSAVGKVIRNRATTVSSASTVAALSKTIRNRATVVNSVSTLAALSKKVATRSVLVQSQSTLAALYTTAGSASRAVDIQSQSSLTVAPKKTSTRSVAITSASTLTAVATTAGVQSRSVAVASTSSVSVTPKVIRNRKVDVAGQSTVAAVSKKIVARSAVVQSDSTLSVNRQRIIYSSLDIVSTSSLSVTYQTSGENSSLILEGSPYVGLTITGASEVITINGSPYAVDVMIGDPTLITLQGDPTTLPVLTGSPTY